MHIHPELQMEVPLVLCLWILLVLGGGCLGCLKEEKTALVQIKASWNDHSYAIRSRWGGEDDCCLWTEVTCDEHTGRVIEMDLSGLLDERAILNATLFLPFEELRSLNFGNNHFLGMYLLSLLPRKHKKFCNYQPTLAL